MNPFAHYLECLNCGNELISINELSFRTPEQVVCDFCGQTYPALHIRVKRARVVLNFVFALLAVLCWAFAFTVGGFTTALFSLFPLFIIYLFTLGVVVKRASRFPKS